MALDSVRSHKFRSFLTVLGIVIGVMTAICIASLLTGMRQSIVAMIEEYGTNNIYAFHLSTGPRTSEDRSERLRKPLTIADAETIKAQAPAVEDLAHVGFIDRQFDDNITYQGRNYRWGTRRAYLQTTVTSRISPLREDASLRKPTISNALTSWLSA